MKYQKIFKRYEFKYRITQSQKQELINYISDYMEPDKFGKSKICNIYFDTPDSILIRRSLEKPMYKEKLRLRSYGRVDEEDDVFLEIKKKYDGIVYKRRVVLPEKEAMDYVCNGVEPSNQNQITKEIDYFLNLYANLSPVIYVSYDREAFYAKGDNDFRMTFDQNIIWRDYDLSLTEEAYGENLIDDDVVIMEIKTSRAIPLWLVKFLSENRIYRTSFSKYGNIYKEMFVNSKLKSNVV